MISFLLQRLQRRPLKFPENQAPYQVTERIYRFRKTDVLILVHKPDGPGWTADERRLHKEQQRQALRESRTHREARRRSVDDVWDNAGEWVNEVEWYAWKAESGY